MARLKSYAWPGNVRELQNVIERAAILARDEILDIDPTLDSRLSHDPDSTGRTLEEVERAHIVAVLESTGGVIEGARGAAKILNLHPNTLRSRMSKLGIKKAGLARTR
jgi:transcriptional regulator with GAF, ATPase, and Fis domain